MINFVKKTITLSNNSKSKISATFGSHDNESYSVLIWWFSDFFWLKFIAVINLLSYFCIHKFESKFVDLLIFFCKFASIHFGKFFTFFNWFQKTFHIFQSIWNLCFRSKLICSKMMWNLATIFCRRTKAKIPPSIF